MQETDNKIVLVDICDTLFDSNTTFDFLDEYIFLKQYKWIRHFFKHYFGRIINGCLWRIFRLDLLRFLVFRFIKGHSKISLLEAADRFYENNLVLKKKEYVFELLEQFKIQKYHIILVSATIDFIAETVAKKNNIATCYSTTLEYKNDICNGKIATDLLGIKRRILGENGFHPPYYAVVTDNTSDIDLVKTSQFAYIIITSGNFKKWKRIIQKNQLNNVKLLPTL